MTDTIIDAEPEAPHEENDPRLPELPDCHPAAELFPLFKFEELERLAVDIETHGLNNPVVVMPDGRILDGRNRWRACKLIGQEPRTRVYDGDEPTAFVVSENFHRRQLNKGQRAFVALGAVDLLREDARQKQAAAGRATGSGKPDSKLEAKLPQASDATTGADRAPQTRDKAAAMADVSPRYVSDAKHLEENAPELAADVKTGKKSLGSAMKEHRAAESIRKAQEKRERAMVESVPDATGDGWWLFHGAFRDRSRKLPDSSIDLIVVDSPDPPKFMPAVPHLAKQAKRVLVDGGLLAVRLDLMFLEKILATVGSHLAYGWMYCGSPGPGRINPRGVESAWQAWIVFSNGDWQEKRVRWHTDTPDGSMVEHLVDALTVEGGTVLDPYARDGAIAAVVEAAGRRCVGFEADPDLFKKAVTRMESDG